MGNQIQLDYEEVSKTLDERLEPYLRLWQAVIENAMSEVGKELIYLDGKISSMNRVWDIPNPYQRQAVRWFLSDSNGVGSFNWTCLIVGIEPSAILRYLVNRK